MRILVSCIPYDQGKSGISVYTRNLIAELRRQGHELTLLVEYGCEAFFPEYRVITSPGWTRKPAFSMLYHLFLLPFKIRRQDFDCCVIAAGNRRTFCFYPVFTIAVIHDLAQYHVNAKYDQLRMIYLKHLLPAFIRKADSVVAISRSTQDDLIQFWEVAAKKITLAYNGLSLPGHSRSGWIERSGLQKGRYLLYISRIEHPGKNHVALIHAFEMLPPEVRDQYTLVLAGADWQGADAVHARAQYSPCAANIKMTGYLADDDLEEAYRGAAVYVFPSLFEGFGLSLIEAMHYGTPCCCSDNSSLGEIAGDAALVFPPAEPEKISSVLRRILTDDTLRAKLVEAGLRRAQDFTWEKHVRTILAACPALRA